MLLALGTIYATAGARSGDPLEIRQNHSRISTCVANGESLRLSWYALEDVTSQIEVVSMATGKPVMNAEMALDRGANLIQIHVTDLPRGMYELRLATPDSAGSLTLEVR